MLAEVLTIGDELCRGDIVDTNRSWLAARLWELQVSVAWMASCRDIVEDIAGAARQAAARSDLVLVSGGLGPTVDDLTVDVMCSLAGVEPEVHQPSYERVARRWVQAGRPLPESASRQVRAPAGARVYENQVGAAPGFEISLGGVPIICLPGPPRELHAIWRDHVAARIAELRESRGETVERIAKRTFHTFGRGESNVADALADLELGEGASLHYQVKFPEVLVKVVVRAPEQAEADERLAAIDRGIRERLGATCYGVDDDSLAAALGRELGARGLTIATAESCTGGLVGALITEVAGSSSYYVGGAVTYSNAEKVRQLGVREATLERCGAVSEECVIEMAAGVRAATGADVGVAVSGVAGPGGGSDEKPVGTVWLAVDGPGAARRTHKMMWPGARDQVRGIAAHWALALARRQVTAG